MSIEKIITFTIFVSFICVIGISARLDCQKINKVNATELLGYWHFIAEISTESSLTKCGYLNVTETSTNGIYGTWFVVKHTGAHLEFPISIRSSKNRKTDRVSGYGRFMAKVEFCVNNSLFYIEREKTGEIYLFSRNITVSSDILDPFEPREGLIFNEYAYINCHKLLREHNH